MSVRKGGGEASRSARRSDVEVEFHGGVIESTRSGQHTEAFVGEGANGNRAVSISSQRRGPFASQDGATAEGVNGVGEANL